MGVTLLSQNCDGATRSTSHQELMVGRLSVNDMENHLEYIRGINYIILECATSCCLCS